MRRSVPSESMQRPPKASRGSGSRTRSAKATLPPEVRTLLAPLAGRPWIQRIEAFAELASPIFPAGGVGERLVELPLGAGKIYVRVMFDPGADPLRADFVDGVFEQARLRARLEAADQQLERVGADVRRARRARIDMEIELDAAAAIAEHASEEARATATELVEAERRCVEGERATAASAMFASVAHDIRSPLTALVWNLRVLEESADRKGLSAEPEMRELFDDTKLACDLIEGVLEGMRAYATSGAPRMFDVGHLVATTVRLFRWHVSQRGVQFAQQVEPGLEAWGMPSEMCQLVLNLLANAAEASPRGSLVSLDARRVGETVCLRVSDEGLGIPAADRERVFSPFHSTKSGGLGIGLTVARSMARKHGGDLVATQRQDGRSGACLELRLPAAAR